MDLKDIIKGIEENGVFEFIVNNYYKLSKEDLRDIAKELDYAIYCYCSFEEYKEITKKCCDNLKELE